jgi:hypothetical protein
VGVTTDPDPRWPVEQHELVDAAPLRFAVEAEARVIPVPRRRAEGRVIGPRESRRGHRAAPRGTGC